MIRARSVRVHRHAPLEETRLRLAQLFYSVLAEIDMAEMTANAGRQLPRGPLRVVAIGKAAATMFRGLWAMRARSIDAAVVVVPDETAVDAFPSHVDIRRASHPLPDARSARAGVRLLSFVESSPHPIVVLLSGGASSLAFAPAHGGALRTSRTAFRLLLRSGATIGEMNTVRRHLSLVHGGGLLRVVRTSIHTLAVSDVLFGGACDIGSGPTLVDPTTVRDARAVLRRYRLDSLPLAETLKRTTVKHTFRIIASPDTLVRATVAALRRWGYRVRKLAPSSASAETLADEYARLSRLLAPGTAVVRAAEPSLAVVRGARGQGGRASHLAAWVSARLAPGTVFLAGASDGVDGSSAAAGAVVHATSLVGGSESALRRFDTATLHAQSGTALHTGPTGLNFADLHVMVRDHRS